MFRSRIRETRFPDTLKLFPVLFRFRWTAVAHKRRGCFRLPKQLSIRSRRKSYDFPVSFPVCREYLWESGSLQTASTAIYIYNQQFTRNKPQYFRISRQFRQTLDWDGTGERSPTVEVCAVLPALLCLPNWQFRFDAHVHMK